MEEKLKEEEIYKFGVWLTIFENGDIFVSTKGDIHVVQAKRIIDINDNRVKTIIEIEDKNSDDIYFNEEEIKVIKKYSKL